MSDNFGIKLPGEILDIEKVLEKAEEKIKVRVERRRYGRMVTIIEGIGSDAKQVASNLKSKLGCGGTVKEGRIELQGDHRRRIKDLLVKMGYSEQCRYGSLYRYYS